MPLFQLAALFLTVVAAVAWINAKALRLPPGVAMLAAGLIGAAALYGLSILAPGLPGVANAVHVIAKVDFPETVAITWTALATPGRPGARMLRP